MPENSSLPENFIEIFGNIDGRQFDCFLKDEKTKEYLGIYYNNNSFANLRAALDRIVQGVDKVEKIPYSGDTIPNILSALRVFVSGIDKKAITFVIGA